MAAKTQTSRNGFTLIEVLVVVAIIALLVSILLPSLAKAREESRRAVCSAHLGSLLKAEYMYQTQNQAWIPGSPLTTGYYFAISPGATPNWGGMGTGARFNRFAINWYDYPTPLRVIMSGASSIRGPKGPADAEETRAQLFKEGVSGVFQCPSNASQTASPFPVPPGASPWEVTPAVSYMTMWNIIRGGSGVIKNIPTIYAGSTGAYETDIAQRDDWDLMVPPDYVPKHNKLGQESTKVFLADGTRQFDQGIVEHKS